MTPSEYRPYCFTCFKPEATCVCGLINKVSNQTHITVFQHPRERAHPIGTTRFVELGLQRSNVVVAYNKVRELELPPGAGLLYPREDAIDLETISPKDAPSHLVVLDGTWAHARSLYNKNAWLHKLKHYRLSPSAPSRYRIRREPRVDYVSTLESVVLALQILEPSLKGLQNLIAAFDSMVDTQIEYQRRPMPKKARIRQQVKAREFRGVPRWFAEDFDHLVSVYAESADQTEPKRVLQVTAQHLASGECREFMFSPSVDVSDDALASVGLVRSDFAATTSNEEFRSALLAFAKECTLLCWNRNTRRLLSSLFAEGLEIEELRTVVRGFRTRYPKKPGYEESVRDAPLFRGRADVRMQHLRGLARHTLEQARKSHGAPK